MDQYIHGYTKEEQSRLAQLNAMLNQRCMDKMELRSGQKVLDVGSGLGMLSQLMADHVGPNGRVLGIEKSEEQLGIARQWSDETPHLEFRQGDAYHLPLGPGEYRSFDVSHTRFLLEHVRRPDEIVKEMVRATKPGGKVILLDDDHLRFTLYPERVEFETIWSAYLKSYEVLGNDPYVGRRLVAMLVEAGCSVVRNDFVFFGSNATEPFFQFYVRNVIEIIEQARPVILSHNILSVTQLDEGIAALETWSKLTNATIWYQICWAEGIV